MQVHTVPMHVTLMLNKQFTVLFQGPKIWNSLPDDIKNTESYNCFRIGIFNHLLQS